VELIPEDAVGGGSYLHFKTLSLGDNIIIGITKGNWYSRKEAGNPIPEVFTRFPAYSVLIRLGEVVTRHLYFKPCDDFTTKSDDELLRLILSHVTLTPSLVGSLIKDGKAQGRKQAAAALRAVMEGDDV